MQTTQTVADVRPADSNGTGLNYNEIDPEDLGLYMQGILRNLVVLRLWIMCRSTYVRARFMP